MGVEGFRFRVKGLGFRVWCVGLRVEGVGCRVYGFRFRIYRQVSQGAARKRARLASPVACQGPHISTRQVSRLHAREFLPYNKCCYSTRQMSGVREHMCTCIPSGLSGWMFRVWGSRLPAEESRARAIHITVNAYESGKN